MTAESNRTLGQKYDASLEKLDELNVFIARMDEKLNNFLKMEIDLKQDIDEIKVKLEVLKDTQTQLRLEFLELKLESAKQGGIWKVLGQFGFQIAMSIFWITAIIIAYKMGLPIGPKP